MKDKIYKIGFLSVCGALFIGTLYLAAYGVINRAEAFATYMNDGMDVEEARFQQRCSMIKAIDETKLIKDVMK